MPLNLYLCLMAKISPSKVSLYEHLRYSMARVCYRKRLKDKTKDWSGFFEEFFGVGLDEYVKYAQEANLKDQFEELEVKITKGAPIL